MRLVPDVTAVVETTMRNRRKKGFRYPADMASRCQVALSPHMKPAERLAAVAGVFDEVERDQLARSEVIATEPDLIRHAWAMWA